MKNLLPFDGEAYLYEGISFFPKEELFDKLKEEIDWKCDEVVMFGKRLTLRRLCAWYGDEPFEYTYSKVSRQALPWTITLAEIKAQVEKVSRETHNSCLLNLYHDDEPELDPNASIASVNLGAERNGFDLYRKRQTSANETSDSRELVTTLRKSKKVSEGRINLTFRTLQKG